MAWFAEPTALLQWLETLCFLSRVVCLGDGHPGIWFLYAQMTGIQQRDEVLDWYHLKENLYKVGGSHRRLTKAEGLLWQGQVDEASRLFVRLTSDQARKFRRYLDTHRTRIVNYSSCQQAGMPIGSGPVESFIGQIDARMQVSGASWKVENVPRMLELRCAYLNQQLDLNSLNSG